jgi:hypothetical protein
LAGGLCWIDCARQVVIAFGKRLTHASIHIRIAAAYISYAPIPLEDINAWRSAHDGPTIHPVRESCYAATAEDWVGSFYPEGMQPRDFLSYCATNAGPDAQ